MAHRSSHIFGARIPTLLIRRNLPQMYAHTHNGLLNPKTSPDTIRKPDTTSRIGQLLLVMLGDTSIAFLPVPLPGRHTNMGKIVRKIISTPDAPKPGAPYSQAVQVNDTLYISGSLGMDLAGQMVSGGIKEQCRQALTNIGAILKAAGIDFKHVVKVTVLLANINDFAAMNEVYKEFFKDHFPARAAYQVGALPKGGLIEIEAVAAVGEMTEG